MANISAVRLYLIGVGETSQRSPYPIDNMIDLTQQNPAAVLMHALIRRASCLKRIPV